MSMFRRFVKDDSGATAIEYGLIAALVSVAIIVALGTLGDNLNATFSDVAEQLSQAAPPSGP
jgi:pilus assembly protein Flp/PilA